MALDGCSPGGLRQTGLTWIKAPAALSSHCCLTQTPQGTGMQVPPEILFRDTPPSGAVRARIEARIARLARQCPEIVRCRVTVEAPHRHHHQGQVWQVRVDLTVPGDELVAGRDGGRDHAHEDVHVAVRDAFDAIERRLEDYLRRGRREVKQHEVPAHGRVREIYPALDYGRIETADGRDVYFHRNAVVDGVFDDLAEGDEVRFAEEAGERGPQASTVHVVGKHHIPD